MIYKMVDLVEGTPMQYVGVYLLKWRQEWGQPEVGFVEDDETAADIAQLRARIVELRKAYDTAKIIIQWVIGLNGKYPLVDELAREWMKEQEKAADNAP